MYPQRVLAATLAVIGLQIQLGGVLLVSAGMANAQTWPQWALNPQHTSQINVAGQPLNQELADIVYDPLAPAEMAANFGELLVHYQVPLIDNSTSVFMEFKSGTYNKNRNDTQIGARTDLLGVTAS